jgi:hypothetical protein
VKANNANEHEPTQGEDRAYESRWQNQQKSGKQKINQK